MKLYELNAVKVVPFTVAFIKVSSLEQSMLCRAISNSEGEIGLML